MNMNLIALLIMHIEDIKLNCMSSFIGEDSLWQKLIAMTALSVCMMTDQVLVCLVLCILCIFPLFMVYGSLA